MSYWNNAPEEYETICQKGIVDYLRAKYIWKLDNLTDEEIMEELDQLRDVSTVGNVAYLSYLDKATQFISQRESDYFGGLTDSYQEDKERAEGNQHA